MLKLLAFLLVAQAADALSSKPHIVFVLADECVINS
jgi:hypothetical protein